MPGLQSQLCPCANCCGTLYLLLTENSGKANPPYLDAAVMQDVAASAPTTAAVDVGALRTWFQRVGLCGFKRWMKGSEPEVSSTHLPATTELQPPHLPGAQNHLHMTQAAIVSVRFRSCVVGAFANLPPCITLFDASLLFKLGFCRRRLPSACSRDS